MCTIRETPTLAAEVQNILDAIEAPPIDDHGLFTFQKILDPQEVV